MAPEEVARRAGGQLRQGRQRIKISYVRTAPLTGNAHASVVPTRTELDGVTLGWEYGLAEEPGPTVSRDGVNCRSFAIRLRVDSGGIREEVARLLNAADTS